jgi:hypothetical protein
MVLRWELPARLSQNVFAEELVTEPGKCEPAWDTADRSQDHDTVLEISKRALDELRAGFL